MALLDLYNPRKHRLSLTAEPPPKRSQDTAAQGQDPQTVYTPATKPAQEAHRSTDRQPRPKVIIDLTLSDEEDSAVSQQAQRTSQARRNFEAPPIAFQRSYTALKPWQPEKELEAVVIKSAEEKRQRFYVDNAQSFLPLLPERNYISDLLAQQDEAPRGKLPTSKSKNEMRRLTQPAGVKVQMKDHQITGLSFLAYLQSNGMPAILADDMGLGKTLQTLSLFQHLRENPEHLIHTGPFLVVCPLSVLQSWVSEIKRFTPGLKVARFHGPQATRNKFKKQISGQANQQLASTPLDVVVTTYETFEIEATFFVRAYTWDYVVLDEAHRIRNPKAKISRALARLHTNHRLLLTGTPLQNNLHELWALFNWLFPEVFTANTEQLFKESFDLSRGVTDSIVMDDIRGLLELILLRRTKEAPELNLQLPPKSLVPLFVPLSPYQRDLYKSYITEAREMILVGENDERRSHRKLLNLLMQLRKICIHPYLVAPQQNPNNTSEDVIEMSGKFLLLDKLLHELVINQGKKVLIFSEFSGVLDCCEEFLEFMNGRGPAVGYLRLDGGTTRPRRTLNVRLFQDDPHYKVLLLSTRAAGEGLTLTRATEVIFLDEGWNPQVTLQAEARAHRIGQNQPVTVYKIYVPGTVEQQMLSRIDKKRYLSEKILENMRNPQFDDQGELVESSPNSESEISYTTLKALLQRSAIELHGSKFTTDDLKAWDWNTALYQCSQDCTSEAEPSGEDDEQMIEDEEAWLSKTEKIECRELEGRRYLMNARSQADIPIVELDRRDRRVGKETVVRVGEFYVSKASLDCAEGEAVASPVRECADIEKSKQDGVEAMKHQKICQVCWSMIPDALCCSKCPRAYHRECVPTERLPGSSTRIWSCQQHVCSQCDRKAASAGGMLFRCRYCAESLCEDCLDWDSIILVGDSVPELDLLNYSTTDSAYFINCNTCRNLIRRVPKLCEQFERLMPADAEDDQKMNDWKDQCNAIAKERRYQLDKTEMEIAAAQYLENEALGIP